MSTNNQQASGLTSAEAAQRLLKFGPNDPAPPERRHRFAILAAFVSNPLVVILLLAAGVSFGVGDHVNAIIIFTLVVISVAMDSIQNARSQAAVKKLQSGIAPTATVIRDGQWKEIPRKDVVPGDLVQLNAGVLVPADCRLVTERDLHVQEAALTGESLPVEKEVGTGNDEELVFLGTSVVSGTATALVEKTGPDTRFGDIARRLRVKAPETEFERGLHRFGMLIMRAVLFLVLFSFLALIGFKHDTNPLAALLFAVALAVGLTPEFLPMITTLTLSKGAVRMSKHKVIVKNLASIQNFGSMDILCSDKTGTLTSGEMTFEKSLDATGADSTAPLDFAKLNAVFESGVPNPLDAAILAKTGSDTAGYTKIDEIPFDFERRRVSVVVEQSGKRILISKGAPEAVIAACAGVDPKSTELAESLGAEGYRALGVAYREIPNQDHYGPDDEKDLKLAGFLAFMDPPLPDALEVIHRLAGAGIEVKVITGDSGVIAEHVCKQIGMTPGEILLGDDIDKMTDTALAAVAEKTTLFARVNPAQKNRIILALKARGHVVGYMGDGINDAPSLHTADIGISFASATDVAKDAAQIILVERSLSLIHRGVLEGRMAFGNVMKYLLMGTSSNFGNMFSMAGAAIFLPFLPMLATQILLNNLLYDLSQVTIPTDLVDPSFIHKPKRWDMRLIRDFMVYIGPISSIFDFLTFWVMLNIFKAGEKLFHTGWFVESLATQTLVIFVIRTMNSPWKSMPSKPLLATTLLIVLIGALLPYTPLAAPLGFVALPAGYFVFLIAVTIVYLGLVEVFKRMLMRRLAA
ncbi:MAG TPA: magnesium-translocating P-type ATPase [Fimbriimonadaceae bacterium]|nr:magnesium-translocating P-type ATPase [Fimbriimonadaceae bacterium]